MDAYDTAVADHEAAKRQVEETHSAMLSYVMTHRRPTGTEPPIEWVEP
jgi:hypothetical protein